MTTHTDAIDHTNKLAGGQEQTPGVGGATPSQYTYIPYVVPKIKKVFHGS